MLLGILSGRLFRKLISLSIIHFLISSAILLLLFLLGMAIGYNQEILQNLTTIGLNSFLLMLFCVAGSIGASVAITPFLYRYFPAKNKECE